MKTWVGVISDTHGWLDPSLLEIFAKRKVQAILHGGDIGNVEVLDALTRVAPVFAVRGNIDGGELLYLPLEVVQEVGSRKVGILHIGGSPKRPRKRAREFIQREGLDMLIVGHSHIPVVGRVDGALWFNPGAAGRQGFHNQRFAALLGVAQDGEIFLDRIDLGPRSKNRS